MTPHDKTRIAATGAVHVRTVDRAYKGLLIRSTVRARIVEAARTLGLPPPPDEPEGPIKTDTVSVATDKEAAPTMVT